MERLASERVFGASCPNRPQVWRWGTLSERAGAGQPTLQKPPSSVRKPPAVRSALGTTRLSCPACPGTVRGHDNTRAFQWHGDRAGRTGGFAGRCGLGTGGKTHQDRKNVGQGKSIDLGGL